jgi:RNA polymerase sigma factor (sigma-70 family)
MMRAYASDTDADLLVYMAMKDEDPGAAREAWAEFYTRHAGYLQAVCQRAYGDLLGGDTGVGDLVAESFRRAFDRAHQFTAVDAAGPDDLRRRVRAWLGRIAQRLFQDALRSRRRLGLVHVEAEDWDRIPAPEPAAVPDLARVERVCQALSQLSDREQRVLRVTFQWYRPGQTQQRLPSEVVDGLAEALETTPENLRQIRRRALEKVRASLAAPSQPPQPDDTDVEDRP